MTAIIQEGTKITIEMEEKDTEGFFGEIEEFAELSRAKLNFWIGFINTFCISVLILVLVICILQLLNVIPTIYTFLMPFNFLTGIILLVGLMIFQKKYLVILKTHMLIISLYKDYASDQKKVIEHYQKKKSNN